MVVTYFTVISQFLPGQTKVNYEVAQYRTNATDINTGSKKPISETKLNTNLATSQSNRSYDMLVLCRTAWQQPDLM